MTYTDKDIENLLQGIFSGAINVQNLPEDLYMAIAEHLENGLYKGFGANLSDLKLDTPDYELLNTLRENVYIFSGAKTYQQVREMGAMVADSPTFSDFKKKAFGVYDEYNKNWLQSEYNTARGQAQQAKQWNDIQNTKNLFPYLEYSAVIDTRTSEICRPLDGVVLPVDDPLWNKYTPLNHFNCRCTLRKIDKYTDVTVTNKTKVASITKELDETVQPAFKMNAGKDGYIFNPKKHPYFEVAPKDKALAKENFNLPIPPPPKPKTYDINERVQNVKKQAKELHETGEGKLFSDAKEHYKTKRDISNDLVEKANRMSGFDPARADAVVLAEKAIEERKLAKQLMDKARINYENKVSEILKSQNAPSEFELRATKLQHKNIERLTESENAFKSIVGNKLMPKDINVDVVTLKKGGRAFFSPSKNSINITKDEPLETITHELGHALEEKNKDYFKKVQKFYDDRTQGYKLRPMRDFNKSYGLQELTKEDKFIEPYTGKWYTKNGVQNATEITSMWFTECYTDLNKFIEKDPEHFEFIYKLFNE